MASLNRQQWSRALQERSPSCNGLRKSISERGDSKCKGPEVLQVFEEHKARVRGQFVG